MNRLVIFLIVGCLTLSLTLTASLTLSLSEKLSLAEQRFELAEARAESLQRTRGWIDPAFRCEKK